MHKKGVLNRSAPLVKPAGLPCAACLAYSSTSRTDQCAPRMPARAIPATSATPSLASPVLST